MNNPHQLLDGRREFLQGSGALIVCASLPWAGTAAQAQHSGAGKPPLLPQELDSWVAIAPDGSVSAFYGKVDLGQGLEVAIAQIVAEELDVALDKVQVITGDTATTLNQGGATNTSCGEIPPGSSP